MAISLSSRDLGKRWRGVETIHPRALMFDIGQVGGRVQLYTRGIAVSIL